MALLASLATGRRICFRRQLNRQTAMYLSTHQTTAYLAEFVEQENACALCLANGLHDPRPPATLELLHKHAVLVWDNKGLREEVVLCRLRIPLLCKG